MKKLTELFRRFSIYILTLIIFAILYVYIGNDPNDWNGIDPDSDITLLDKFFNRFYFTTISLSRIGYGDITPKTQKLKAITIVFAMFIILEMWALVFDTKWNTKLKL